MHPAGGRSGYYGAKSSQWREEQQWQRMLLAFLQRRLLPRADVLEELRAHALAAKTPDEAAEIVAREAHRNQLDKVGKEYIDHPRRVAYLLKEQGFSPEIVAAGWLHDTIEDTWMTTDILGDLGFSEHVVCMVDAMTKREGESSEDYIQRLLEADAVCVKRADLADNTCPIRRAEFSPRNAGAPQQEVRRTLLLCSTV